MQNATMLSVDTPSFLYSSPAERGFVGRMMLPMKRAGHSGPAVDIPRGKEKAQVDEDPIQVHSTQRQHSGSSRTPDPVQSWSTGTGQYTKARYPRLFERTRTPNVGYTVVTADDWAVDTPHRRFSGTGPYSSPPQRAWAGPTPPGDVYSCDVAEGHTRRNLEGQLAAADGLHWEVNKKTLLDLHGASLDGISVLLAQAGQKHTEALDALERRLTYSLSTAIVDAEVRAHERVLHVLEARDRSVAAVAMLSDYGANLHQSHDEQHPRSQLTAYITDPPAHQHKASTWFETVATGSESAPSLASPVPEATLSALILGQRMEGKDGSPVLPASLDSGVSPRPQDGPGFLSPPVPQPHQRPRVAQSTTKRGGQGAGVGLKGARVSHSPTTTTSSNSRSPTKQGGEDLSAGTVDEGVYMPLAAQHVQMMKPGADSTADPSHTLRLGELPLHVPVHRARMDQAAVDTHIARMEAGRAKAGLVPHVHGVDCAGSDKGWPCREGDDVDAAYSVGARAGTDGARSRGSVASTTSTATSGLYPPNRHSLSNLMQLHAHTGAAPSAQS